MTLAASMGGMSVGALAIGAWLRVRRPVRPLRLYGALELAIGVSGLLMLPGFRALEAFDARVFALEPALAPALHVLGMALVIAPATLAMGATLPALQLVAQQQGASISVLYGVNTAGAAAGVLLLSFVLLPRLGVWQSCVLVATLNGAVFVLSGWVRGGIAVPPTAPAAASHAATRLPVLPQLAVVCTGFATFGLEVAWFRALRAAFWTTSGSFAVMLAAVLIPMALGARCVPWLRRRAIPPAAMLTLAGAAVLLATLGIERMDLVAGVQHPYAPTLAISLALVGPAVFCMATALPWFLEEHPEPGATARLYALNTLGSVAGSLLVAWGLLPLFGFARSAWLLALLVLGMSALLHAPRRRWIVAATAAATLGFAAVLASSPGRERMLGLRDFGGHRVVAHEEDADFTASVIDQPNIARALYIDGFSATSDDQAISHYMRWMGILPALLHPDPVRGLVICFGTGQTADALRRELPGRRLDIAEISRTVLDLAPFFEVHNNDVLGDPNVEAIAMDGRAWLRRTDRRYDVITLEPMPPNFSGVNALYSREFYAIAARRLASGGIVAQWLPIHLLSANHAASIVATFVSVFPDAVLWIDPVDSTGILLGRLDGDAEPLGTSWPGLSRRAEGRNLSADQIRSSLLLDRHALARYAGGVPLVTDDNQLLQFSDLRNGLGGQRGRRRAALARRPSERHSPFSWHPRAAGLCTS